MITTKAGQKIYQVGYEFMNKGGGEKWMLSRSVWDTPSSTKFFSSSLRHSLSIWLFKHSRGGGCLIFYFHINLSFIISATFFLLTPGRQGISTGWRSDKCGGGAGRQGRLLPRSGLPITRTLLLSLLTLLRRTYTWMALFGRHRFSAAQVSLWPSRAFLASCVLI